MSAKILLTGATGFIGSHVLQALSAAGLSVTVLVRRHAGGTAAFPSQNLASEVRYGDICDLPSLCKAACGCDQIIHTAGLAKDWGPREAFQRANVTGTLNVLEAARSQGVSQVIITGSISSYGEENSAQAKDENFPYHSHYPYLLDAVFPSGLNFYRDSKALATQQAVEFSKKHHLNVTIIEPVWVFGEREFGTGFYSYVKAVKDGSHYMPGSRYNCFHVIYARDLAKAYLLASQRRLPGVERIIVGNPRPEPMHQVFGLFCEQSGLARPHLLPKWSIYPVAIAMEAAYALLRRPNPPLLTRGRVAMFYDSIQYATEKAHRLLGFQCDYSLEQGIHQTVNWYKENHYL